MYNPTLLQRIEKQEKKPLASEKQGAFSIHSKDPFLPLFSFPTSITVPPFDKSRNAPL